MKKNVVMPLIVLTFLSFLAMTSMVMASPNSHEQKVFKLLNAERGRHGLQPLKNGGRIVKAARRHSKDMIEKDYFSHVAPDGTNLATRLKRSGLIGWTSIGENIAGASTVEIAFDLWMKSPGHYRNMMDPDFNHVGIGVIGGGPYGLMFTMDLAENPKLAKVKPKTVSKLTQKRIRNAKVKIGRLKGTKTRLTLAKKNNAKPYQLKELRRRLRKLRALRARLKYLKGLSA